MLYLCVSISHMLFTNNRSNVSPAQNIPIVRAMPSKHGVVIADTTNGDVEIVTQPPKKGMKWGEPTWLLFHTLAEKVKPEKFAMIRTELLNTIYTICTTLPCPECAKHATKYMNSINFNAVQTKEQLKDVLFTFHNEVNKRKNYPLFPRTMLESKYAATNTVIVIQNFMMHYEDKHSTAFRMIADDFHRKRISTQLKHWFTANLFSFNM